jgi:hypothetical protein
VIPGDYWNLMLRPMIAIVILILEYIVMRIINECLETAAASLYERAT